MKHRRIYATTGLTLSLTAFGLWFLQQTIGESIKEAWLQSQFHHKLVDYLTSKKRRKVIDKNVDRVLDAWSFDKFLIEDVKTTIDNNGDINVRVVLSTLPEIQERIEKKPGKINIESITEKSEKIIELLDDS